MRGLLVALILEYLRDSNPKLKFYNDAISNYAYMTTRIYYRLAHMDMMKGLAFIDFKILLS